MSSHLIRHPVIFHQSISIKFIRGPFEKKTDLADRFGCEVGRECGLLRFAAFSAFCGLFHSFNADAARWRAQYGAAGQPAGALSVLFAGRVGYCTVPEYLCTFHPVRTPMLRFLITLQSAR